MFWQLWRAVLRLRKSMVSRCKWSLYCARFTLHGLLCTVYSEQFTLHDLLCKIYSAQFTPHDLLCSIYSAVRSDQWWVWQCLLETCLEVVWWLWSPHLPSPTFTALLLNHAPLQTSLQASYTPHTNFLPARDHFWRVLSVEGLDQRRWGNGLQCRRFRICWLRQFCLNTASVCDFYRSPIESMLCSEERGNGRPKVSKVMI